MSDIIPLLDVSQQTHPTALPLSRCSRHIRLSIFLLLEIAYIALAVSCYYKPIFLPTFLTFKQGKGIVTVTSIAWQTIAVIPVSEIALFVFSGEWSVQLLRTGRLVPGTTDKVSTLTASFLDRLAHFHAHGASNSYRAALVASLTFIALTSIAPGTFFTSLLPRPMPIQLQIANVTFDSDFNSLLFALQRPALVTRLEQIEKSRFGYDVEPAGWVVGWPPLDLRANDTVQYPSDGVRFQYNCTWEAPEVTHIDGIIANLTTKDGSWNFWDSWGNDAPTLYPYGAVLLPLTQVPSKALRGLSAYLFLGSNATNGVSPFDLSGIPTTYRATGYSVNPTNSSDTRFPAPPLASVLICDPSMKMFSVSVARETNLSLRVVPSNSSTLLVGNISEDAASLLFRLALLAATSPALPFINNGILVNFVAASLFMSEPTVSSDTLIGEMRPLSTRPLGLSVINANMDKYVLSASKAYAGGYLESYGTAATFVTMPVNGTVQVQRLALEANKPYLIFTAVVVAATTLLLEGLTLGGEGGVPLTLGSMVKEVQQKL